MIILMIDKLKNKIQPSKINKDDMHYYGIEMGAFW